MPPWKRRDRNRQDKGDTAKRDSQPARLKALGYCTTVLLYYCTTVLLLRAPASRQLRPPKQLKMIIETDPPLLRILVVWGGGVNNQETTLLPVGVCHGLYTVDLCRSDRGGFTLPSPRPALFVGALGLLGPRPERSGPVVRRFRPLA